MSQRAPRLFPAFAVIALVLLTSALFSRSALASDAQAEAAIRQEGIDADLSLYHSVRVEVPYQDEELPIQATGWFQGTDLVKVEAEHASSHGSIVEKIYFDGPVAVLVDQLIYVDPMEASPPRLQWSQRFIFEHGSPEALQATQASGETQVYTPDNATFSVRFAEIQDLIAHLIPPLTQARLGEIGPVQGTQGNFAGIEQGDYFHLLLKTPQGEDLSFFILRTDHTLERLLADEAALMGQPITVYWRTITEAIPQAGGSMPIEVAIAVRLPGDSP